MDFFKFVFSDDPSTPDYAVSSPDPAQTPDPNSSLTATWSFNTLMTSIATKSESVLQTYRRDLAEITSGLKNETAIIRDVASRAVKELPASLEAGASVAQVSLESVGQAIDDIGSVVWKPTAEIVSHGKEAVKINDDDNEDNRRLICSDLRKYSRFEAQVRAIRRSVSTYLEDLDLEGYEEWKVGFSVEERGEEIASLMREDDGVIGEIHEEIVPEKVDDWSFWCRYFYRVHRLKEAEEARARLVERAVSCEEEDLSWDFDDDEEVKEEKNVGGAGESVEIEEGEQSCVVAGEADDAAGVENVARQSVSSDKSEGKFDSGKESDFSIVSSQPSMPREDDLGWDEIENIGSGDEKKEDVGSMSGVDLHKRLSAAVEEEDLSWDIEDEEDNSAGKS